MKVHGQTYCFLSLLVLNIILSIIACQLMMVLYPKVLLSTCNYQTELYRCENCTFTVGDVIKLYRYCVFKAPLKTFNMDTKSRISCTTSVPTQSEKYQNS